MALDESLRSQITQLLEQNRVVLFMKGTRNFPQCGFSATVVQILDGLVPEYHTVNVLKDPAIREGIKEYTNWPTIPQLYVDGKFIGGCDIVREMFVSGELHGVLGVKQEPATPPSIELTPAARDAVKAASQGQDGGVLRLSISSRFEYELTLDEPRKGDFEIDAGGIKLVIDRMSAPRANGIRIDYSSADGGGFSIDNPNEPPRVRSLSPQQLKSMLDKGEKLELIDVRSEQEYGIAKIAGGKLLDVDLEQRIEQLDKSTPLVFYCHHGMRSQNAAERFVREGFRRVYNLQGGIDAWSREVDPNVPRY